LRRLLELRLTVGCVGAEFGKIAKLVLVDEKTGLSVGGTWAVTKGEKPVINDSGAVVAESSLKGS